MGTDRGCRLISRGSWGSPIGRKAIAFISALLPLADPLFPSAPALARDGRHAIDIPAGPLDRSLSALSQALGLSLGYAGALPHGGAPPLRGTLTAEEALRRILDGSGLRAVRVGPLAFRIEAEPRPSRPPVARPMPAPVATGPVALPDIIVTGQKRPGVLGDVPMSLSVIGMAGGSADRALDDSGDVALAVEGLAATNLGPGRNRQFIRGVADSPFNGLSQSTVAVQLDDARVTFDAPDPDLRLVDVERVEVLKGPQGPLYGSGALGGIYHIVTRKPDLDNDTAEARVMTQAVQQGGAGGGGDATINLPLDAGRLGMRVTGYAQREPGWIDNIGRDSNANATTAYGGRAAIRWRPAPDWTFDIAGVLQQLNVADSQYVSVDDALRRRARIPEPTDNDFHMAMGTIDGRVGGLRLVSATSYVDQDFDYRLDASRSAASFGLAAPITFREERDYTILNQELRVSPYDCACWVAGLSYMRARSQVRATIGQDMTGTIVPVETADRQVREIAAFGEATLPVFRRVEATLGARLSHTVAEDEIAEENDDRYRSRRLILSPSASLSWKPDEGDIVYLRYARALRPGSLTPAGSARPRFDSDELGTFDFGVRHRAADGRFTLAASLYYTLWRDIQSDYLLPNGLISTRNAGRGRIIGGEATMDWRLPHGFRLSAGANAQSARLTATQDGLELKDRRLPVAPGLTGRLGIANEFTLGGWTGQAMAQGNYIGHARLTLDETLDREMGGFATVMTGLSFARGGLSFAARIENLMNITGDSFAFGNPFSILSSRQYTPIRPRTFTLSVSRSW